MSRKEKRPPPVVRKTTRGISPVDVFCSETISADPVGTEYDLVKRSRRSNRQLGLYWKALSLVVANDERWPTSEALHECLKRTLGFVTIVYDLAGKPFVTADSTAFDAMDADQFRTFMDKAMSKLSETLGWDPLSFLEERAA